MHADVLKAKLVQCSKVSQVDELARNVAFVGQSYPSRRTKGIARAIRKRIAEIRDGRPHNELRTYEEVVA